MTPQEIDRIESAIRHIQTATDVDQWASDIAVLAMRKQIPQKPNYKTEDRCENDLISRRKTFEYFVTLWECIGTIMDRDEWEDVCMTTANEIPSAQSERKKGRWIVKEKGCKLTSYKCSKCGRYITDDTGYDVKKDYPFCHCGADMREDADE